MPPIWVIIACFAVFQTHLDFIQLGQDGAPCSVTSTPGSTVTITVNRGFLHPC